MSEQERNELMVSDEGANMIADLTTARSSFCSLEAETPKQKAVLFAAMNNPEKRIGDCINEIIEITDVYAEFVDCTNRETGEIESVPRTVLIDKNGVGYQAVSKGIFGATKKLFQVYGMPTWETPVKIKINQITKGERKMLSFTVMA